MENLKRLAVQRFITNHPQEYDLKMGIVTGLANNPDLIRDLGYRGMGLESALTIYQLSMFALGVSPENIDRNASAIQQTIQKRNGKLAFVKCAEAAGRAAGLGEIESSTSVFSETMLMTPNKPIILDAATESCFVD